MQISFEPIMTFAEVQIDLNNEHRQGTKYIYMELHEVKFDSWTNESYEPVLFSESKQSDKYNV